MGVYGVYGVQHLHETAPEPTSVWGIMGGCGGIWGDMGG